MHVLIPVYMAFYHLDWQNLVAEFDHFSFCVRVIGFRSRALIHAALMPVFRRERFVSSNNNDFIPFSELKHS